LKVGLAVGSVTQHARIRFAIGVLQVGKLC